MGGFDTKNQEAIIRFAEEHEDFAKAYVAASITNGHRERRDLLQDLGDYSSIAKSTSPTINISLGLEAIASLVDRVVSNQQGDCELRILYPKSEVSSQALI